MFELVPSEYMRNYFKEVGFEFTDFQKATLIWNAFDIAWKEKLSRLQELAKNTDDEILKNQIKERIVIENKKFSKFIDNQMNRYVYVVEDNLGYSVGFFLNYDRAMKYAKKYILKYNEKFLIHKQLIVNSDKDEIVTTVDWKINSNGMSEIVGERTREYDGDAVATIYLDLEGNIHNIYSDELPKEEEKAIRFKKDRFENLFLRIPFDAKAGMPVKDLRDGSYGILADDTDSWNFFYQKTDGDELYLEFGDTAVTVYKLYETGLWSHVHINPLYLEYEHPIIGEENEKSRAFWRAMESMSDYLSSIYCERRKGTKGKSVVIYAREYADICESDSQGKKQLRNAKVAKDIMR